MALPSARPAVDAGCLQANSTIGEHGLCAQRDWLRLASSTPSAQTEAMAEILAVMTNVDAYRAKPEPTGLWLGELTHFEHEVVPAGHRVTYASPRGGPVPLDPRSLGRLFTTSQDRARLREPEFKRALNETTAVRDLDPARFDAVYFTGGHGTMFDFADCVDFGPFAHAVHSQGGVVAAVCHGVCALLAFEGTAAQALVEGAAVTGYSDFEETMAGVASLVPFSLQKRLSGLGARYEKAMLPFRPFVRTTERLLTGQNPQSTRALARAVRTQLDSTS